MNPKISKTQAEEKIQDFFSQTFWDPRDLKKIKRLAMKFRIPLKPFKKKFCKSCLKPLKGKVRISKETKTISCSSCQEKNRFKLNRGN